MNKKGGKFRTFLSITFALAVVFFVFYKRGLTMGIEELVGSQIAAYVILGLICWVMFFFILRILFPTRKDKAYERLFRMNEHKKWATRRKVQAQMQRDADALMEGEINKRKVIPKIL